MSRSAKPALMLEVGVGSGAACKPDTAHRKARKRMFMRGTIRGDARESCEAPWTAAACCRRQQGQPADRQPPKTSSPAAGCLTETAAAGCRSPRLDLLLGRI